MYTEAQESGRFQMVRRTEGVSSTGILQRLANATQECANGNMSDPTLVTAQRLAAFMDSDNRRDIATARRVVYVCGTFDMLHEGDVEYLEKASTLGDYLLVGLHDGCGPIRP